MSARRTKIMATIGPASDDPAVLRELIEAGMDAARVGLAHGDIADSIARIGRIRAAATAVGRHVTILVDLPGPKVRAAAFPEDGALVRAGAVVHLQPATGGDDRSDASHFVVDYPALLDDVRPGDAVGLGDGGVTLLVEEMTADAALARVQSGGGVRRRPGGDPPPPRLAAPRPPPGDPAQLAAPRQGGNDAGAVVV